MPLWLIAIKELRWKQYKWSRTSQDKVGQFLFGRCTRRQSVSTKCHFQQVETVWIQIIRPSSAALQSGWIQEVCDPACMYLLSGVRLALGAVRLRGRNPSISRWNEVCVCVCLPLDGWAPLCSQEPVHYNWSSAETHAEAEQQVHICHRNGIRLTAPPQTHTSIYV